MRLIATLLALGCTMAPAHGQLVQDLFTEASNTAITAHTPDTQLYPTAEGWNIFAGTPDSVIGTSDTYVAAGLAEHVVMLTTRTDFTFAVKIKITSDDTAGVSIRAKDSDDFIFVELLSAQNRYRLGKKVAGTNTFIDSATVTINTGTFYVIKVDANGNSVSATFDGANTISGTISDHRLEGRIGLLHPSGNAEYDSVEVQAQSSVLSPQTFTGIELYLRSDTLTTIVADSITGWCSIPNAAGDTTDWTASDNKQPYLTGSGFGDHSTVTFHGVANNTNFVVATADRPNLGFAHKDSSSMSITFKTAVANPDKVQAIFSTNGALSNKDGTQMYLDDTAASTREDQGLEILRSAASNVTIIYQSDDDDYPALQWNTFSRSYHDGTDPDYMGYNNGAKVDSANGTNAPSTVNDPFTGVLGDWTGTRSTSEFNGQVYMIVGWHRELSAAEWSDLQTWINTRGTAATTVTGNGLRRRAIF